jgi:hypothetical protein
LRRQIPLPVASFQTLFPTWTVAFRTNARQQRALVSDATFLHSTGIKPKLFESDEARRLLRTWGAPCPELLEGHSAAGLSAPNHLIGGKGSFTVDVLTRAVGCTRQSFSVSATNTTRRSVTRVF